MSTAKEEQINIIKLVKCVQEFIKEQDITCPEVVAQCDNVIINAIPFIKELCDIVGYIHHEEDIS